MPRRPSPTSRSTIAADPDPVAIGQEVTYTVTVTNDGPDPATGVTPDRYAGPGRDVRLGHRRRDPGRTRPDLWPRDPGRRRPRDRHDRRPGHRAAGQAFTNAASVAGAATDPQRTTIRRSTP